MKSTKKSLLLSTLSLVLCFAMLLGTTYAWFTDEVTSGVNQIKAGNLDVELYHSTSATVTADENSKVKSDTKLFNNITKWEPGMIAYENFTVKNVGNLALKYQLGLTIGDKNATTAGHSLDEVLKATIVPGGFSGNRTAAQALTGYTTLENFSVSGDGALLPGGSQTFAVVIYWQPTDHDNDYNLNNDKTAVTSTNFGSDVLGIELGVKLFATQLEYEKDSFDEHYDGSAALNGDYSQSVKPVSTTVSTQVKENEDTVFTAAATPANENGKTTTVTVPASVKKFADAAGSTSTMTIEATPTVAANKTFTISSNGAVGAIDLEVKVNDEPVTQFEDEDGHPVPVIVETYIAKGLTGVSLSYNNTETWTQVENENGVDAVGKLYYDKTTGRMLYMTTHFSTFVLGANEVAYLESNNTAYLTLKEAFENASANDTLTLLKAADMNSDHATVSKNLTFDLNGKTANMQTIFVEGGATLQLTGNGKLNTVTEHNWTEAVYVTNGNLILAGIDIMADARYSGAVSFSNEDEENTATKTMDLTIADGTTNSITSTGDGGSALMFTGYCGDLNSSIKGGSAGTGKLIATAKTTDAWSAVRMYGGRATASLTMTGFNGVFKTESDTYRSFEQGYGNTILVKDMTSARFSHDETQFMQPGYMTKQNSEGTYDYCPVGEEEATCKIVTAGGETTYIAGSIYQALNLAPENSTITLLKDHEIDTYNSQPLIANHVTVDLNNKTVSGTYGLSIKKPDTNPEHNYNVCEPIYVTIRNGTMNTSTRFEENSHITYENVKFVNPKSSFDTGVMLYSDLNTSTYTWASPAENSIVFTGCEFTNYNVELTGRSEPQKIDATFTNCTFTKDKSASDSIVLYGDTYGYGSLSFDGCTFNGSFNNGYTYPIEVNSTSNNIGSNTVTLTIKDTNIATTGSCTKPVNKGVAGITEQGTNIYTVNGTPVNYDGPATN